MSSGRGHRLVSKGERLSQCNGPSSKLDPFPLREWNFAVRACHDPTSKLDSSKGDGWNFEDGSCITRPILKTRLTPLEWVDF